MTRKSNISKLPKKGKIPSFDGTMIYNESIGEGGITFAPCNGVGVSTFFWKYFVKYFSQNNRIILWDYRSHGKSDPAPDFHDLTMTNNARDLKAVLDHHEVEKVVLLGHSMGCQTIFEFYSLFPERVLALIPILGSYGNPISTFLNTDKLTYLFPIAHFITFAFPWIVNPLSKKIMKTSLSFPIAKLTGLVNWQHCKYEELEPYLEHLGSLDLRAFMGMAKRMQEHTAKQLLPNIKVPALIIAGEDDIFTPWKISEEMHKTIPDAEMLTIPHGSHAAIIEQPELINLRIEKFIKERVKL